MYLSKSKYCNAVQCKKMLWLNEYKPEEKESLNESVLENGTQVGELAKNLFGFHIDVSFNENLKQMIDDTKSLLYLDKVVITEASFEYDNNFCSVDILKKNKSDFEIYEVKSSTEVKDIYKEDISYQYYILNNLGYNVTKASIVYINSQYERNKELNLKELFNIEDVTEYVKEKLENIKLNIKEINNYMNQKREPDELLGIHCVKPYNCPFFKYCTKGLGNQNVFTLKGINNNKKFELYNKGIFEYEELLKIKISDKIKQQIEFELYDEEDYIDKTKIKEFLDKLTYPLYFLDFETFQMSIPLYDKTRPYMQIPFQYSLHYIINDELKHKEFLSEPDIDPRRKLAESLVKDIPKDVCVLAYNMAFEKMVIKELAILYEDLSDHLMNIYKNIKDLMIPFKDRYYYSKNMHGIYSIKYVLPALYPNDPSLDYKNLDLVHNGSEAMNMFANMCNLDKDKQKELKNSLLKYCELDTYAMVKIFYKLKEVTS